MQRPGSLVFLLSLLATALSAQESTSSKSLAVEPWQAGVGTEPLPGARAGTVRYNVTFATRSFDLEEFRQAIEAGESAAVVGAIVRDLELRARSEQEAFRKAIEALGGGVRIQFWLINACSIEIPPAQLARVRAMANVLLVAPDLATYPLAFGAMPWIRVSTDANHHNADAEQALGNKGNGAALAIVDTSQNDNAHGVNLPHMLYYRNADRTNHTGTGMDGSRLLANVAKGAQPANNNHPHGTGVAGITAGAGWNTGTADAGHASDANIVGYSICDVAGTCGSSFSTEAAGWQQVAADKVLYNIVAGNMSYGSSPLATDVSQQAIDACAINANILPCTAAGNTGPGGGSTTGSSSTCNGLAVAAIDPTDKTVAPFSSRGPISDGGGTRLFPDIAACGVNTVMPQDGNETTDWIASGTSMATPQVTGAAGLARSARPASTARELKALLLNSTESVQTQNPSLGHNDFGVGFLRDDLACSAARQNRVLSSTINSTTTPNTHPLAVTVNQIYNVTLVWNRHILTGTQWSNLDLRIKNGATVVATGNSPRNLYEKVEFSSPITGNLTIEVSAGNLEIPNLPYAVAFGLSPANGLAAVQNTGVGCVHGAVSFYEDFSPGTFDLANRTVQFVPNGQGYTVLNGGSAYVPPTGTGLGLGDDTLSSPITLPFTFVFPGGSTNQIRICSNGFVHLNGTGTSASYTPLRADLLTGGPRLLATWMDLLPDGGSNTNNVFYNTDGANNRVLISWRNVPEYGASSSVNTFQIKLYGNGNIELTWQAMGGNTASGHQAMVGFSPGAGNRDPGNRDISATLPFTTQADRSPLTQSATRPILGSTCNLLITSIPAGSIAGVDFLGIPTAPIDLTAAGMPGCFLHVNPLVLALPFSTAGSNASIPLSVPNDPTLLGTQLSWQAASITPGLNALGAASSNLTTLVLGQF